MPYPIQIEREKLIETARQLIEAQGVENLSLRLIADELGVKAPSLYKHIENKDALLRAVNELTLQILIESLYQAVDNADSPEDAIFALAQKYRGFAHANPVCYSLAYNSSEESRPNPRVREALILPLQAKMGELVGEENAFPALRGAYAFLHGWVILEISRQFEREGDLDEHFEQAFRAFLRGWL